MMKIGSVVKTLGIPASTIRYYEKISLIKPMARVGNSRHLDEKDIAQLKFIQRAQAVGFSIDEIKDLLGLFSKDSVNTTMCHQLIESKLAELEEKMRDLKKMHSALSQAKDYGCQSLEVCVERIEQSVDQTERQLC